MILLNKTATLSDMENHNNGFDLAAQGLDHTPMVASGDLEIPGPTLKDNTAWVERTARAAVKKWNLSEAAVPLGLAPELSFPAAEVSVWAACRVGDGRGRIVAVKSQRPPYTCGLAVDLGSATLVLALVDLNKPAVLDRLTIPNPQLEYGTDILTRVHYSDRPENLTELVRVLREAVNRGAAILAERWGMTSQDLVSGAIAGNTVMTHFLLGLPVRTLIREPYVPVVNLPPESTARQLGLNLAPEAPILVMPNRGSYFGGDLMAGLVASGMNRAEKPCFLVDVGTNAEVVLGQKDWLVGAAGAAGPALEGGVAAMGMIAGPGAIDWIRIDRQTKEVAWRTVDDQPPKGICGSGLLDLYAELFLSGIIDFRAKLTLPPGHPRRVETDEGPAFIIASDRETAHGRPITMSEVELDILTRSKAAMYTILNTVLLSVGLALTDVDRFYVAGTFGQYIDPRMAVAVGMIPDMPLERFKTLGNSSLQGTILALVSARARAEIKEVWQRLTYLEMNVNQDLMNRFSAARFLPHTNRELFPSVGTLIK